MTLACPKLRSDLTVVEQSTPEGAVAIVREPASGRFFRLGAVERCIVEHCDGATPLEVVRTRVEAALDAELPFAALERFLASLDAAGLLDSGREPSRQRPTRRWIRGHLLYLRIRLADPDRLLARLVPAVGPCFTTGFAWLSGALIATGAAVVLANLGALRSEIALAWHPSLLPLVWLVVWIVMALHELGHGLACKRLGGDVHEMGFLLIYLQPAAYCDVSDAWLFPDKQQRVLVTLAGPVCELCVWALCALVWRMTDAASGLHLLALIVVATSGVKTLFNLNPLLKLDGYYLLSDLTDMPNLRRRAFREFGERLSAWLGRAVPDAATLAARERRLCLGYGVIAFAFSIAFLAFAIAKLGRYLVRGNTLALLFCVGLLSVKLPRRVRRLFPGATGPGPDDDDDDWDDGDPQATGQRALQPVPSTAGVPDSPGSPAPESAPGRLRRALPWLVSVGLVGALVQFVPLELRVPGPFVALPARDSQVRAQVDGTVDQVLVEEGQAVRAGDLLVRLSAPDTEAELHGVEADIAQARARLAMLVAGPTPAEIAVAVASDSTAAAHLPFARARRDMDQQLFEIGVLSRKEAYVSQEAAAVAERAEVEAASRLRALRAGTRPELIEAARAELAKSEARRAFLAGEIERLAVPSPVTGVVATPSVRLHALATQRVQAGDLLVDVHDARHITAQIAISERDIADVRVGETVQLKARAYPGRTFHGTVTAVGVTAQNPGAEGPDGTGSTKPAATAAASAPRTLVVTTEIGNPALLLRSEMTGQAKIACGRRRVAGLVRRWLVRTLNLEFGPWS